VESDGSHTLYYTKTHYIGSDKQDGLFCAKAADLVKSEKELEPSGASTLYPLGYEDGALDPVGSNYYLAYNKYTMELRYPVILKQSSQIYVLGFLEGGNGFASWKEFSPFKIKRSAGLGVRLYLPIVGLLGLDLGWGFDAPAGENVRSGSQFHFTMGQTF